MSQVDGHWHQSFCVFTRIAEHKSLIPCTLFLEKSVSLVNTCGDIRGLFINCRNHGTSFPVETHRGITVTDVFNGLPYDLRHIHVCLSRNFARNNGHTGGYQGLAGYSGFWILLQHLIQNTV